MSNSIEITDFGAKSFDPRKSGTKITDHSREQVEYGLTSKEPVAIREGYAPFCKLFFFENWTNATLGCVAVTEDNDYMLKTGYEERQDGELPVLSRWFEDIIAPQAKILCVVCYDKEQLAKEGQVISSDWGAVAFLGQRDSEEQPMIPITMMRNALGIEEGGSGYELDRDAYLKSVEFWQNHALIR